MLSVIEVGDVVITKGGYLYEYSMRLVVEVEAEKKEGGIWHC